MLNLSLYLVILELSLMVANILVCVYFLLFKRTVLIKNEGLNPVTV